jgi:hypothetical protein
VTNYSGVDDALRRHFDRDAREGIRQRYALPNRFLLYAGAIYPPKNFTRLVQAYARVDGARETLAVLERVAR